MTAIETIKQAARAQYTNSAEIAEAVVLLAGDNVSTDQRTVRAALIEIYIEREGEVAGDELMDAIGL